MSAAPPSAQQGDRQSGQLEVDGLALNYEIVGDGEPVLLLHGLGSCTEDWQAQTEHLRQSHRVIAVDLRGHGRSAKPRKGYSIERFAKDTAEMLEKLGTGPVHVVGLSLGGMVAFQLVLDAPALVKTMTIVNSGPEVPAETFKQRIPLYIRLVYIYTLGLRRMAKVIAKKLFPAPNQAALRDAFIARLSSNPKPSYVATLRAIFAGWGVADRLGEIRCPVLFIAADQDYSPVSLKQTYVDRLPDGRMVVVPDSRHALPIEKPDEFNRILAGFLANPSANPAVAQSDQ